MEDKLLKNQQQMPESCQFEDRGPCKALQSLTVWVKKLSQMLKSESVILNNSVGTDKLYIYYIKLLQDLLHLHKYNKL